MCIQHNKRFYDSNNLIVWSSDFMAPSHFVVAG
jgi:hypothetical protein